MPVSIPSSASFTMLFHIRFDKGTHRNHFELMEVSVVQRGARQLTRETASPQLLRNFGMNHAYGPAALAILQYSRLVRDRDFKLAFDNVVFDRSIFHTNYVPTSAISSGFPAGCLTGKEPARHASR
jgi:hypothetical protein